jgi:hypothetical protein
LARLLLGLTASGLLLLLLTTLLLLLTVGSLGLSRGGTALGM